jgi:DNA-binding GntR family transcriptional regulator
VSTVGDGGLEIASVVDQVYGVIRERILTGALPRGARVH